MLNKVMLIGNLGADPEMRTFPSGDAVANLRVATSRRWKDKQTGENKEVTDWHRVVFNNRLAEIAGQYLKKGSKIYVEGRLHTRKWQGNDGKDNYTTEIIGEQMQMLDSKGGGDSSFGDNSQSAYAEPQPAQHYQQPAQQYAPPVQQYAPVPPVQQYAPAPAPQPMQQPYNPAPMQQPAPQFNQPPAQQPFNPAPPPQFNQQPAPQFRQPPSAPAYDDFDDDVPF